MSSFFSNILKPLTGKKEEGRVVGSRTPSPATVVTEGGGSSAGPNPCYDATFTADDKALGMTIVQQDGGTYAPVVASVLPSGAAGRSGITPGDRVISVDGNLVDSYEDLQAILGAIGRPVTFRFQRASSVSQAYRAPTPTLLDDEREARRLAMSKAAEERTKSWEKKLQSTREKKTQNRADEREKAAQAMGRFGPTQDEATKQLVEHVKRVEVSTAQSLGYNPYQAQLSSSNAAKAMIELGATGEAAVPPMSAGAAPLPPLPPPATSSSSSSSSSQPPGGHGRVSSFGGMDALPSGGLGALPTALHVDEQWLSSEEGQRMQDELDVAWAVFVGQDRGEAWATARNTLLSILGNLLRDPANDKYRRLRLSNPTFQSRVAAVHGGMELLAAAGFEVSTEGGGEDAFFVIRSLPPPGVPPAAVMAYDRLAHFNL